MALPVHHLREREGPKRQEIAARDLPYHSGPNVLLDVMGAKPSPVIVDRHRIGSFP